jgi:3-hydroxyanthranilate 3,4-dioxygenase
MLPNPLNLQAWIEEHRHLLKPPVGNKCIYDGDFIVMVVGGPNQRTDYHWDEGPEWFYQLEGEMVLRIQEDGKVRDIPIKAGEIFLLPPRTPHSPQRMPECNHKLYEEFFPLQNIETDFPAVFDRFYSSREHRTCRNCGHVNPAPSKYVMADT